MSTKTSKPKNGDSTGNRALGFEATLWATADKLRGNLDAAEYKHVVLGLIVLKYISDAFEQKPFEQKMKRLTATLEEQFAESAKLEKAIRGNLKELDF